MRAAQIFLCTIMLLGQNQLSQKLRQLIVCLNPRTNVSTIITLPVLLGWPPCISLTFHLVRGHILMLSRYFYAVKPV